MNRDESSGRDREVDIAGVDDSNFIDWNLAMFFQIAQSPANYRQPLLPITDSW
jgi:hypothetical protein